MSLTYFLRYGVSVAWPKINANIYFYYEIFIVIRFFVFTAVVIILAPIASKDTTKRLIHPIVFDTFLFMIPNLIWILGTLLAFVYIQFEGFILPYSVMTYNIESIIN